MISERCTSPRRWAVPGRVQGDGAEHPDHSEGDAGDERGAAGAVGEVQAVAAADHLRAQSRAPCSPGSTATSAPTISAPSAASSGA